MTFATLWNASWIAALVNHLWQSTAVVAMAWLFTLALKKNSARVRYSVWMVASLKFLVPFALFVDAGTRLRLLIPETMIPEKGATMPPVANLMQQFSEPLSGAVLPGAAAVVPAHHASLGAMLLIGIWLCGFIVVMARWARNWVKISAALRTATLLDTSNEVPLYSTHTQIEPGIFGIFRPALLIPDGILNRLDSQQLNAVIAHEICHARRRDNLTFALHMVVEALFWFHPAVWWIGVRLIEERELACDEAVINSGNRAEVYAEGILKVCKHYIESPLACASGVSGSDLKKRIIRIMSMRSSAKLDLNRKILLYAAASLAVVLPVVIGLAHVAQGQAQAVSTKGITGVWQGTLHAGSDLRTVIKVMKDERGSYNAVFYSIDRGGRGFPADLVTLDGSNVKINFDAIGGKYEGKLNAEGNTIDGTWNQGPNPLQLILTRATPASEWTIPSQPAQIPAMTADANPSFEVATIKPNNSGLAHMVVKQRGRSSILRNASVSDLVSFAYGVQTKQIVSGPAWINSQRYDIEAIPDAPGMPSLQQVRMMTRKLLADRFGLKSHSEKRVLPAYVLGVADGGEKLTLSKSGGQLPGLGFGPAKGGINLHVMNTSMPEFAGFMQELVLDRPVLDRTGLSGKYDFQFIFAPDDSEFGGHPPFMQTAAAPGGGAATPSPQSTLAPNLFEAMRQQVGLRLRAEKTDVDVIVIDHLEQPTPN